MPLAEKHPNIHPIVLDVTNPASIIDARDQIHLATNSRGPDAAVNAAGTLILGPVEAVPDEFARAQFEVNLFGLLAVTRAFLPAMRERGQGRIVNISSVLGRFVLPGTGLYSATNYAVEAASDALRMELSPFGVRVVLVEPGVTNTPLYESGAATLSRYDEALQPYRTTWTGGFAFPQRLLRTASAVDSVATAVVTATLARKPRARYRPGLRNRINTRLLTALPTPIADSTKKHIATDPRPLPRSTFTTTADC